MHTPNLLKNMITALLGFACACWLTSCGMVKGQKAATQAINTFHQQYNASQFNEIYTEATPALRQISPKNQFFPFIQAIRSKLGAFTSGSQAGWRVNATTDGTFLELTYTSQFERGGAQETFTYLIEGDEAILQGYHVNSPALVLNGAAPPPPAPAPAPPAVVPSRPLTVADAQREAVRLYPDLGKAGTRLNAEFVSRHQRYQREHPEKLRDPSWPLTLAAESAAAIQKK